MKKLKQIVALSMSLTMLAPSSLFASSHREAPTSTGKPILRPTSGR
jgi:hypothetical protein